MTFPILLYRFFLANILSAIFGSLALFSTYTNIQKNPSKNPWELTTVYNPSCLNDTQYGVHKTVKVNNLSLHVVDSEESSKPMMLFVHGYPECWYTWRHQMLYFKTWFRTVSIDMRGYGDSDKPDGIANYTLDLLIEDMKGLITNLGYKEATILSHDWGGIVSCKFRDVYPNMTSALVMLSSTSVEAWFDVIWNKHEQNLKSGYLHRNNIPYVTELLVTSGNLSLFDDTMIVKGKNSTTAADLECFKYYFSRKNAFTPPLNYYRANFQYNPKKIVHTENTSMYFLMPSNEPYLSHEISVVMEELYTHITTATMDGVGHFLHQEEPDKVNQAIKEYLVSVKLITS